MDYQFEVFNRSFQEDELLNLKGLRKEFDVLTHEWKTVLEQANNAESHNAYFAISSDIAQEFKEYLLYLRNAYLEKIYAEIKLRSNLITEDKYTTFTKKQVDEYIGVKAACNENIKKYLKNHPINESYNYQLTLNPKDTYSEQFKVLKQQFAEVQSFETTVRQLDLKLGYVNNNITNYLDEKLNLLTSIHQLLSDHKHKDIISLEEISTLVKQLEKQKKQFQIGFNKKAELEEFLKTLETYHTIPSYEGGLLKTNDLNVSYMIEYWLSFKVYKDMDTTLKESDQALNRMIISLKREIDFMMETSKDPQIRMDKERVKEAFKELPDTTSGLSKKIEHLKSDFDADLTVHSLIYSQHFFDRRISQSYDQLIESSETAITKLYESFRYYADRFSRLLKLGGKNLSENEEVINYLKNYAPLSYNSTYYKLFHNQSGVYNHYTVDRTNELQIINECIANWRSDLGNSILVYGAHLSGKTTLLNSVVQTAKFDTVIQMAMGATVEVDGRKIKLESDLNEALSDVAKSVSPSKQYLIVIDDVELWRNEKDLYSMQKNLNRLIHFIGTAPLNLFFMVSCNRIAFKRFDAVFSLSTIFSSIIDISRTQWSEFYETLLRRQDTIQMDLTSEGRPAGSNNIRIISRRIFKQCNENLGLSLLTWSKNISPDLKIKSNYFRSKPFPWIENKKNRHLLDNISLFRKVSYQELLHNYSDVDIDQTRKMIGRFRKIGLLQLSERAIEFNPHTSVFIENQLLFAENQSKYKDFTVETMVEDGVSDKEIREALILDLLLFPFLGEGKLDDMINKSNKIILSLNTIERPAAIIQHINNRDHNIKVEYNRRLS